MKRFKLYILALLAIVAASCEKLDEGIDIAPATNKQRTDFDIMVVRDGQVVSKERTGMMTKAGVDTGEMLATMDEDNPFGLIGIDFEHGGRLLLDNTKVESNNKGYSTFLDWNTWGGVNNATFSAYYPYVTSIEYGEGNTSYAIPFSATETDAGPLVSETVEKAIQSLNMMPLHFKHITNDIGYKICDITPDKNLQGLIHLRKVTAYNVA